uniref:Cytochrome c oxidase subunit n=1 Tax=Acartia pacifica TaxID=335913 RepID=A0A0U2V4X1_ACAPC|nr:cytochrome c oxidase subunit 6B1-like protein [Acartia pacifica]
MASEQELRASIQTIPFDPRFPNQNQTRNCWQNYVDFHRCQNIKGEDYEPCQFFKKCFTAICPMDWVEKWDDQRANGAFPAKLD